MAAVTSFTGFMFRNHGYIKGLNQGSLWDRVLQQLCAVVILPVVTEQYVHYVISCHTQDFLQSAFVVKEIIVILFQVKLSKLLIERFYFILLNELFSFSY